MNVPDFELQLADEALIPEALLASLRSRTTSMVLAASADEALDQPLELCLRLVDDAEIRALNRDYRGHDRPTDVLAFALREAPGGEAAPHVLGDVVVSVETAERQRRSSLEDELVHLFAHGLCHLLGYDHGADREEAEMNTRIARMLETA